MNLEDLESAVKSALEPAFRGRLLARGQARSMIWREGKLPPGAPDFASTMLTHDLLSYGDALLSLALRIREQKGDQMLARQAFEQAGEAIEAVVSKGDPTDPQRGFLRLLSASAFHLAHLSARAFSMLVETVEDANLSRIEKAISMLILRSLDAMERDVVKWHLDGHASDNRLTELISTWIDGAEETDDAHSILDQAIDRALSDNFFTGLGHFIGALRSGDDELVETAKSELEKGLAQCKVLNLVPQWWCFRLSCHLIDDLWGSSFHKILPKTLTGDDSTDWLNLRELYTALLFCRERSEIELWPSQIEAARRSVDPYDNLVVSLPTSAGKTRIAELCILRCLSIGKRVVFVTPLRALSAQTERSLRQTFDPLGKRISTLYGSIGSSRFEDDMLRKRDIVVATPEKLDFALRNDPTIIDDVGLIVLDEGHMIGLGEREVRYEVQIQRLLNRADAAQRRIVCLSAILPDGEQFTDFVNWLREDKEGKPIKSNWRPTRIRFGEVLWRGDHARLEVRVGDQITFVPQFFKQQKLASRRGERIFPRDKGELVLATAWRLVEDGQSVLIYCPVRSWIESLATRIVDLAHRGFLNPLSNIDQNALSSALAIGAEWLGSEHDILKCLKMGVAVHHGALPTPFRKEVERLLAKRKLPITISSPTLAQGLNLTATAVVMYSLYRYKKVIPASEFRNVVGRAGRAFVDVEGIALFPIFDRHNTNQRKWSKLIDAAAGQEMESGLFRLVIELLTRMSNSLGNADDYNFQEYVLNSTSAWDFPILGGEDQKERKKSEEDWKTYLAWLDTALLSLLGEHELGIQEIAKQLDIILSSSLWQRILERHDQETQGILKSGLVSRAHVIWSCSTASQRRGYFRAGVGLSTGQKLDAVSQQSNELLIDANGALLSQQRDVFVEKILSIAEILFGISPFIPEPFPEDWRAILGRWLRGQTIVRDGTKVSTDTLRFVENGLVYKLPWGMEAMRVRAQANGDQVGGMHGDMTIDDFEVGVAVPAIETGTMNICAAMLMQAGFTSRLAAVKVVEETGARFTNAYQLNTWLESDMVRSLSKNDDWPTPESRVLWNDFRGSFMPRKNRVWTVQFGEFPVSWSDGVVLPKAGTVLILHTSEKGYPLVMNSCFKVIGKISRRFSALPSGLMQLFMMDDHSKVQYKYCGPDDVSFQEEGF